MLRAIWAQSLDGVIGDGTDMPWYLPEDLKHFKELTLGAPVIMGRNTWESLPEKARPLPGRANYVMSHRLAGEWSRGAQVVTQLPSDGWLMGGGQLYRRYIQDCEVVERTLIDVYLLPFLGDAAVVAPKIPDGFHLDTQTPWMESHRGRITAGGVSLEAVSPGLVSSGSVSTDEVPNKKPVRYRFQRFVRSN